MRLRPLGESPRYTGRQTDFGGLALPVPTSHPPPVLLGEAQPAVSTRILASGQFGAHIRPFSITLKKAPGRELLIFRAPRISLELSPLPDTRSTRMTVTAGSALRPPDWTQGRPVAALALRPNRPTGSLAAALPPGLKDVSSRSPRFAVASGTQAGRETHCPADPQRPPAHLRISMEATKPAQPPSPVNGALGGRNCVYARSGPPADRQ